MITYLLYKYLTLTFYMIILFKINMRVHRKNHKE